MCECTFFPRMTKRISILFNPNTKWIAYSSFKHAGPSWTFLALFILLLVYVARSEFLMLGFMFKMIRLLNVIILKCGDDWDEHAEQYQQVWSNKMDHDLHCRSCCFRSIRVSVLAELKYSQMLQFLCAHLHQCSTFSNPSLLNRLIHHRI